MPTLLYEIEHPKGTPCMGTFYPILLNVTKISESYGGAYENQNKN